MNPLVRNLLIAYGIVGGMAVFGYFLYWVSRFGDWIPAAVVVFLAASIVAIAVTLDETV